VISRSDAARRARALFFRHLNDIDVYVEDMSRHSRKFYLLLINNILGGRYKIHEIHMLGGKRKVVAAASKHSDFSRRAVYIVDGDLDLILARRAQSPRLVCLGRYCIENYLLEEDAICEIIHELDLVKDMQQIKEDLSFADWLLDLSVSLTPLFAVYAAAHARSCGIETVSYPVHRLRSGNGEGLCPRAIYDRHSQVLSQLLRHMDSYKGLSFYIDCLNQIRYGGSSVNMISGKDYILPLLFLRIRRIFGGLVFNNEFFIQRLASKVRADDLRSLISHCLESQAVANV